MKRLIFGPHRSYSTSIYLSLKQDEELYTHEIKELFNDRFLSAENSAQKHRINEELYLENYKYDKPFIDCTLFYFDQTLDWEIKTDFTETYLFYVVRDYKKLLRSHFLLDELIFLHGETNFKNLLKLTSIKNFIQGLKIKGFHGKINFMGSEDFTIDDCMEIAGLKTGYGLPNTHSIEERLLLNTEKYPLEYLKTGITKRNYLMKIAEAEVKFEKEYLKYEDAVKRNLEENIDNMLLYDGEIF